VTSEEKNSSSELEPRATPFLVGHEQAAEIFLKSYSSGRMHHGWLLAGPKGIGKATLAYHLARYLLKQDSGGPGLVGNEPAPGGSEALHMAENDPVFNHVASGAEGNLMVIERGFNEKTKRMRQEIIVDDVRALHDFFELTASHEGWRIAIVDSADEMNRSAANALLKMLEEPPRKSILFLVSHTKGRLPATIRSRCQQLLLNPLSRDDVGAVLKRRLPDLEEGEISTLAGLSAGAPGFGARMALCQGMTLYKVVRELLDGKTMKTQEKHDFAGKLSARGQDEQYFLFLDIMESLLAAKIRSEAPGLKGKRQLDCWLALWEKVTRLRSEGEGLNMGRKQGVLLLIEALEEAHKGTLAAA